MTKNRPIQIMISLAIISLIGIITVQVYWVSQAVNEEEEAFDHNVRMSLRKVADNMCQIDGNELIQNKPIDRVARNYFIARLQYNIDVPVLDSLISSEFELRGVNQLYEYGVYNCESNQMVFGSEKSKAGSNEKISVPKLEEDEYYFGVYFPKKEAGLLSEMNIWKFMTAGTIIMLLFFGYGLVVVLKQRRLSEIQKDFINNVTHELKTPLATLKLSSEAIQRNVDPDKTATYGQIIQEEIDRLQNQVDQILSSSLIENSHRPEMEIIETSTFLMDLITKLKASYPDIVWDLEINGLPEIRSNKNCIEVVIRNLIDNAAKYGHGQIKVSTSSKGNKIALAIHDDGPGIPREFQKKIFNKFFRIPTENVHDVKGYGLGMFMVKQHLKSIGGTIEYSNEGGSTFTIKLPAK